MNKVFDMKQLILVFCLLFVMQGAVAQHKRNGFTPERFQAELEQYITKKACLTPKEASKFFRYIPKCLASNVLYIKNEESQKNKANN